MIIIDLSSCIQAWQWKHALINGGCNGKLLYATGDFPAKHRFSSWIISITPNQACRLISRHQSQHVSSMGRPLNVCTVVYICIIWRIANLSNLYPTIYLCNIHTRHLKSGKLQLLLSLFGQPIPQ
jgi:hypothetical protein